MHKPFWILHLKSATSLEDIEIQLRYEAQCSGITHYTSGIAVLEGDRVLLLRRTPTDFLGGKFELPGGGIEEGESFRDAVRRELLEETGLRLFSIKAVTSGFDYSTPHKPKVRQFNFLVSVKGRKIHLQPSEHDGLSWASIEDLSRLPMSDEMSVVLRNLLTQSGRQAA